MTLFTDSELTTLESAGKILAARKLRLLRDQTIYDNREAFHAINKTLANYPNWHKLNNEEG